MTADDLESGSSFESPRPDLLEWGPLGLLPRVFPRQVRLGARLARIELGGGFASASAWLSAALGTGVEVGLPEILDRPSGLRRTGVVAQLVWTRLFTRVGLGLDTPLAHAVVDRLLGFDRPSEESRNQVSPVEWGVLTFITAKALRMMWEQPGPLGAWDLMIDRVSVDPFDATGLGRVLTFRWPVRIGAVEGSARLWVSEKLTAMALAVPEAARRRDRSRAWPPHLVTVWHARIGLVRLGRGLRSLKPGGVLPLYDATLRDVSAGPVDLVVASSTDGRHVIRAEITPCSDGGRLTVLAPFRSDPSHLEPTAVSLNVAADPPQPDPPVTLVVELGRVNLTLERLADLKPGDVLELNRHSREPVELTSGGRTVARGELVQIDTDLGVRVTHVFL